MQAPAVVVVLTIVQVVLIAYYWPHCARPALWAAGARPLAIRVVASMGIVSALAFVAAAVVRLTGGPRPEPLWLLILVSSVWYFSAWLRPDWIARMSGGIDPSEALRRLVWSLNWTLRELSLHPEDREVRAQTVCFRNRLATFPRTPTTGRLIGLWLEEADLLFAGSPRSGVSEREAAIWDEARRLWPDGDAWHVAAPYRAG